MATGSTISPGGLRRARRYIDQYRATHGTPPPRYMLESFVKGEVEGQIGRIQKSEALGLQKEQIEGSLDIRREELDLKQDIAEQQQEAARVQGVANLAIGGALLAPYAAKGVKKGIGLFKSKPPTPAPTGPAYGPPEALAPGETFQLPSPELTRPERLYGTKPGIPTGGGITQASLETTGGGVTPLTSASTYEIPADVAFAGEETLAFTGAETAGVSTLGAGTTTVGGETASTMGFAEAGAGGGVTTAAPAGNLGAGYAAAGALAIGLANRPLSEYAEEQVGTSASHVMDVTARAGQGALIGASVGGPYGAAAGAIVGGMIGIAEEVSGSVICTELYRQGLISDDLYEASQEHGRLLWRYYPQVMIGYRQWAIPVSTYMKRSKVATKIVAYIAIPWIKHAAWFVGRRGKDNKLGRLISRSGINICYWIGKLTTASFKHEKSEA